MLVLSRTIGQGHRRHVGRHPGGVPGGCEVRQRKLEESPLPCRQSEPALS